MVADKFQLGPTSSYWGLVREIYKQEKSFRARDLWACRVRKEELFKEAAIGLVNAKDIRQEILHGMDVLETKYRNARLVLARRSPLAIVPADAQRILEKPKCPIRGLDEQEQRRLFELRTKWTKTDAELVGEEIQRIRCQPRRPIMAYLKEASDERKARFKKWGGIAYRGIGVAAGAMVGGIVGWLFITGLGATLAIAIGTGVGSLAGLFLVGVLANTIIVNHCIPMAKALDQAGKVKKARRLLGVMENPSVRAQLPQNIGISDQLCMGHLAGTPTAHPQKGKGPFGATVKINSSHGESRPSAAPIRRTVERGKEPNPSVSWSQQEVLLLLVLLLLATQWKAQGTTTAQHNKDLRHLATARMAIKQTGSTRNPMGQGIRQSLERPHVHGMRR